MAKICNQISAEVKDKAGALAEITDKVKDAGVNILAMCAWSEGEVGHLMMVTDDNDKACKAITPHVETCQSSEVVCLKIANERGALNEVVRKLANAGLFINFTYCTGGECPQACLVIDTSDNAKAAEII